MYRPRSPYSYIALKRLTEHFGTEPSGPVEIPEELFHLRRGCFVSLHNSDGSLRGCIGTIEPVQDNLVNEIRSNAMSAAFSDSRFPPLSVEELPEITISVDVLTEPQEVSGFDELDPAIYGVIVSDGTHRRGVLLPSLEGVDTVEKQIDIARRKAGLAWTDPGKLKIYRFTSTRYH
ncbi:MAG: AmmeMemoRadiSam system protein A [Bacteroidales bacterium]